ncbi:MAG: transketolase [Taibaiella sp.]|nr:transketolase [Taibaiella sp.]
MTIEEKCIDAIRCLAIDAIQKADSGHPGAPMALAPAAFTLWMKHMRYNPKNPSWFNRDRFVLSNGHASMLQYAVLHLTGYAISMNDIENFRQLGSITAGHPEHGLTPGVETTTGPLGQGFLTAVGMAIAEAHLASCFNKEGHKVVDHYTYVFCSDGDLMEGASHEAASIAGHLELGKLIYLYDNNHITIEGDTSLTYSDDVAKRFESYHWHVQDLGEAANDIDVISEAFQNAKDVTDRPSIIILRTHIGYGSPNKQDTAGVHGSPLGDKEVTLTKEFYGWPDKKFFVPDDVKEYMHQAVINGEQQEKDWNNIFQQYKNSYSDLANQFEQNLKQELPAGWDNDMPIYKPGDGPKATRSVSSDVINLVAPKLPWFIGGSADLGDSTQTILKSSGYYGKGKYENRNIAWGIREHCMCAASSGMMLHGGVRPFASTYFVFTDYAKPAIRLACIMELPVIYVMTHDSIGLGEDGKTHQPVEQLITFRALPNIVVLRPADANEAAYAWSVAIKRKEGPTMLVLSRQKLPIFDRDKVASAEGVNKGAYILSKEEGDAPDVILIATGSEVQLILDAQQPLRESGINARIVSMPSWELFREQPDTYRDEVLPPVIRFRLAVEAAAPEGWHEWIGAEGEMIGMREFGASAPSKDLFVHFGFTVENIIEKVKKMVSRKSTLS